MYLAQILLRCFCFVVGVVLALPIATEYARADGITILHSFTGGSDGANPHSDLIADQDGSLYGTTVNGGDNKKCSNCGTVFKLAMDGTETTLHVFGGVREHDGANPYGGLLLDAGGNLYGTTYVGGIKQCSCGIIFKLAADGAETVLYNFAGSAMADGANPQSNLIADGDGNLYGTTLAGGNNFGTVFRLTPDGKESVRHAFSVSYDGQSPSAGLLIDAGGNLYGATSGGGGDRCRCGAVFKVEPDGTETVLHSFSGTRSGSHPRSRLVADPAGNFYGTASTGGDRRCDCGVIFKLTPDGKETVLHVFKGAKKDGASPVAGLAIDPEGILYGTTVSGGKSGCGTVFRLAPDGTYTLLHVFIGSDGCAPYGGLLAGANNTLFGTTDSGGANGKGTVFTVSASPNRHHRPERLRHNRT